MSDSKIDPLRGLAPFSILVIGLSSLIFCYLYLKGTPSPEEHGLQKEVAEIFGTGGLWTLAIIYGRSILKILLNKGELLQRLIPEEHYNKSRSLSFQILAFLNRTHKYAGAFALVFLSTHSLLMGLNHWNLFLMLVLVILAWQGLFGIFLVVKFALSSLKRYGYLVHAQLFTGVMIAVFAAFGHLLV